MLPTRDSSQILIEHLQGSLKSAVAESGAKTIFLANVSHELRTPLSAVLGFAELLSYPNLCDQKRKKYVAALKRNTELLSSIINDILDLSKVEAGKLHVESHKVNIVDLLSDIETLMSLRAKEKNIFFKIDFRSSVTEIVTDPVRLKQILLNIIGNAIKFTSKGSVSVSVELLNSKLAFIVQDSGIGISDDQAVNLFETFSQADETMFSRFGGSGLGLALSKQLAGLLGGEVELTSSKLGKGSVFTVTVATGLKKTLRKPKPKLV